jgi:hypothetical protein
MKDQIINILQRANSSPYLFVGSGFSRRYIGLPDWAGLLKNFAKDSIHFSRLKANANGDLPTTATLLAKDFSDRWWEEPRYEESRKKVGELMVTENSPLKYEISEYLRSKSLSEIDGLSHEINSLKNTNIDGIITTNWDCFLERIFPEYTVYGSQSDLIFSNIQGISEIYKIHGCSSNPDSLVLTSDDYSAFNELNPYLASKIITIFMEHPIIFVGYSISDKNIQNILLSIAKIIPADKLEQLGRNLIFLNRSKGKSDSIKKGFYSFGSGSIPATLIETDDYSIVYDAIGSLKRKIPVKYLRLFKSELHEIVRSNNPKEKIFVVDEEKLDGKSPVQFVVGVGVASAKIAALGYKGVKVIDLYRDLLISDAGYNSSQLLDEIPGTIAIGSKWIPIFKYLRNIGINRIADILNVKLLNFLPQSNDMSRYCSGGFSEYYINSIKNRSFSDIVKSEKNPVRVAKIAPYLKNIHNEIQEVEIFLKINFNYFEGNPSQTYFRKLACLYDFIKYGDGFQFD